MGGNQVIGHSTLVQVVDGAFTAGGSGVAHAQEFAQGGGISRLAFYLTQTDAAIGISGRVNADLHIEREDPASPGTWIAVTTIACTYNVTNTGICTFHPSYPIELASPWKVTEWSSEAVGGGGPAGGGGAAMQRKPTRLRVYMMITASASAEQNYLAQIQIWIA